MSDRILTVLQQLGQSYPELLELEIKSFVESDETVLVDDVLYYASIPQALVYLTHHINNKPVVFQSHFNTVGTMIDLSRNAVFTVEYLKGVIQRQAMMGVNRIMLYLEDIYVVSDEPYFGYMRGRYSKEELQEVVQYAELFGVEVIPCIQTLGHFEQYLRWRHNAPLKDNHTVIMPDTDESLQFIERLIRSLREMFKTDKIHIGMDEAFGFGLGRFYKKYGYHEPIKLFLNHLNRVNEICLKYGFTDVMMWSDMFFRMQHADNAYYNPNFTVTDETRQMIPDNVTLVYWDYYNRDIDLVSRMIRKHVELTPRVTMASGTWIWTKLNYDKKQTDRTAKVHIEACQQEGIKDLYFTQWNDDGALCNYETSFLGVFEMVGQALTGNGYAHDVFEYIMRGKIDDYIIYSEINEAPVDPLAVLWDDPLNGIYFNNEQVKSEDVFNSLIGFLETYQERLQQTELTFERQHTEALVEVIRLKTKVREGLVQKYKKESLAPLIPLIERTIEAVHRLNASYRTMWLGRYKAFGLDVIQSRLGMLVFRLQETILRITDFESGKLSSIDELEEKAGPHQWVPTNHMLVAYSSISALIY